MAQAWTPSSWQHLPARQQPEWPDADGLHRALKTVASYPPLVFAGESRSLQSSLAHVAAGNVDFGLVGTILLGSVPGVWLGSHWSVRVDPAVLRTTLAVVLIGAGLALLIKAGLDIPIAVIVPFPLAVIALLVVTMVRSRKARAEVGT